MKKLFLLASFSLISNSFCAEMKDEDFDKEIIIERGFVHPSGDILRVGKEYAHPLGYYIARDSEDYSKIKQYAHYKFILKRLNVVPEWDPISQSARGTPVKIVRFELLPFDNKSCTIL